MKIVYIVKTKLFLNFRQAITILLFLNGQKPLQQPNRPI